MESSWGSPKGSPATLVTEVAVVFSKRPVLGPAVDARHAPGDHGAVSRRRGGGAVGGRRGALGAREAGGEGADAAEPDREADVRYRAVGGAQQRRGALEAASEQVGMR